MSAHRCRRLDRRTAEQMLNGVPAAGGHALNDLLVAAAAPARDGELAGEQAAVTAFGAARLDPIPQLRRRSMIKTLLAKLLTVKIAATAAAVTVAAGGVAAAAATGYLPTPSGGGSTVAPASSTGSSASGHGSADDHSAGADKGRDHDARQSSSPGSPSPSLVGLCHAYTAGAGSEHGKALGSPAFTVLITTAGGKDKVAAYCTKLLAAHPEPAKPTVTVTPSADPGMDHSGQAHATNNPSTRHPDPAPTSHPTGAPVTHPGR